MAAKSLKEAIVTGFTNKNYYPSAEEMNSVLGETRDYLAHSVARFCKRHNAMRDYDILTQFVQEVIKELPSSSDAAQIILDESLLALEKLIKKERSQK